VSVSVLGINLGTFHGNLKDGIGIKVDLFLVVGDIRLSLKNGNEVWVYLALKVKFDGSFNGDYKIIYYLVVGSRYEMGCDGMWVAVDAFLRSENFFVFFSVVQVGEYFYRNY